MTNPLFPIEDTLGLVVWTAAEMAVTLVCIGIPASRSLCKRFRDRLVSEYSSEYRKKAQQVYALRSIGGSQRQRRPDEGNGDINTLAPPAATAAVRTIGLGGPYTMSSITGPNRVAVQGYDRSDEEVLLESPGRGGQHRAPPPATLGTGIIITEEFRVTRT